MVFSSKALVPVCFLLLLVPLIVYAENYTTKIGNKTITIVIKPNNTIIIEPQNNSKLEKLIQTIADKPEAQWHQGDIIIASSTIVAFFGFGSFLIIRFKSVKKDNLSYYLDIIMICTWTIQALHISVIGRIILNLFDTNTYDLILLTTIGLLGVMAWYIRRIIRAENNLDTIRKEGNETMKNFMGYISEKYKIDTGELQKTLDEFESKSSNNNNQEKIDDGDD